MHTILDECGMTVRLAPTTADNIRVQLKWIEPGLFRRMLHGYLDLDLGCYYELADGTKNLIDCLQFSKSQKPGNEAARGSLRDAPYILHSGDADGSEEISVEDLQINPLGLSKIKRIMVYAYIFEGPARWQTVHPSLTISTPGCDDVEIKIDPEQGARFIALAGITPQADGSIIIENLGTCHSGHADCDSAYGWGFNYKK